MFRLSPQGEDLLGAATRDATHAEDEHELRRRKARIFWGLPPWEQYLQRRLCYVAARRGSSGGCHEAY